MSWEASKKNPRIHISSQTEKQRFGKGFSRRKNFIPSYTFLHHKSYVTTTIKLRTFETHFSDSIIIVLYIWTLLQITHLKSESKNRVNKKKENIDLRQV